MAVLDLENDLMLGFFHMLMFFCSNRRTCMMCFFLQEQLVEGPWGQCRAPVQAPTLVFMSQKS